MGRVHAKKIEELNKQWEYNLKQEQIETQNIEKTGIDILVKGMRSSGSVLKNLDNLGLSFKRLLNLLEAAENYVKNVLEGKQKEDAQIGRMLWDTVSSLPKIEVASFEQMWNNSMTDLLMIVYLANITKSQIITTEQLQSLPAFKTSQKNTKEKATSTKATNTKANTATNTKENIPYMHTLESLAFLWESVVG